MGEGKGGDAMVIDCLEQLLDDWLGPPADKGLLLLEASQC